MHPYALLATPLDVIFAIRRPDVMCVMGRFIAEDPSAESADFIVRATWALR